MFRSSFLALVFLGALSSTGAAFASEQTPSQPAAPLPSTQSETPPGTPPVDPVQPPQAATEPDPMDVVVCKKEEATVGSRLGSRKVCKTRRQWRDEQRDATSPDLPDGSLRPAPGPNG